MDFLKKWNNTTVLTPGKNLGWEGGLELGLKSAQGQFICFQNDDTLIPHATKDLYSQLLWPFNNQNVAAVGPATTTAAGWHSCFNPNSPRTLIEVPFLIFFTAMVRRTHLEQAGGIDTSAPGGDDLDLCMRLRKLGKNVLLNPDAFIIHHAFKTGERVKGGADKPGGWNSKEMSERTSRWLIQKHGFKFYLETLRGFDYNFVSKPDVEGDEVARFAQGKKIVELGCGFRKTLPQAIGVDICPKGEVPLNIHTPLATVADIQADVTKPLPRAVWEADTVIARHILEHCIDTVDTLRNWNSIVKMGGRLVIAVPNQDVIGSIPLNPEHVHAFTAESLKHIVEACGFKQIGTADPRNGISFVSCFEKVLNVVPSENGKILESVN